MGSGKPVALVVDDEALVLMMTADMLDEIGFAVAEAASAEDALALVDGGLAPDLLLTDQSMPGMQGSELATELLARFPDLQVLVATGYSPREIPFPTITKPFLERDLRARIEEMTGNR